MYRIYELASFTFIILSPIINVPPDIFVQKHYCLIRWRHGTRSVRYIYIIDLIQRRGCFFFSNKKKTILHSHRQIEKNPKTHPPSLKSFLFSSSHLFSVLFLSTPLKSPRFNLNVRGFSSKVFLFYFSRHH